MDVVRSRRSREDSPDRARVCMKPRVKHTRKVQVVYYLTRNGHLEHPHYIEVTHSANHPLRLRDVMERLTALRGKGMPSLYSWSCKRSYKNGYVWNDLEENDVIYPSDGAEYVLKGSELVDGCSVSKRFQLGSNRMPPPPPPGIHEPSIHSKQKLQSFSLTRSTHRGREREGQRTAFEEQEFEDEEEQEEEAYELDEEKTSYTSSTTPHSRCSRGVSTDEPEEDHKNGPNSIPNHSSPPPTASILSEKPKQSKNSTSQRFEDGDPVAPGSASGRNSVLLQLISCGNLAVSKAKNVSNLKQPANNALKKSENLHKGVLCKSAVKRAVGDEDMIISCMSENPRFGNLQTEEKEYFSGSIVEAMSEQRAVVAAQPALKKSNSYNEERSCKAGFGEIKEEEERRKEKVGKGNCIPRKKLSSALKQSRT
ncbi:hypothetical protein SLEP1_g23362 [Rubroshorea leprosula]|uniref:SOSEKI DIX-like domain-containing protein n=1 Tax=Rubroshorea leprosula TaxID=152421 RepID=A0AAV5JN33_9ROSI|nr:hypothetical protein SLEP1_g23362 [Rubroshorea leprosula]